MAAAYWKRFAALGTAFATKYKSEAFFRTELHTIALQTLFAAAILIILSLSDEWNAYVSAALVVVLAALFGYVIVRVALQPAREALESQKHFIGNIAHELRTPLSTIKTNTEVALFDDKMQKELRAVFESNIEEIDRASDILNNLLTLNMSIRPERTEFGPVDLADVAQTSIEKLATLAKRKAVTITLRRGSRSVVWGNRTALEQITSNVIKNAIFYTPREGRVLVSLSPARSKYIELTVEDNGIGIAQKDLYHIFEPFFRAERSRTRSQGGSGLGLTIVSELVRQHRGRVTVRSSERRGTTVIILLPEARAVAYAAAREGTGSDMGEVTFDYSGYR